MNDKKGKRRSKGFTLIELVVVVAILGILAAIAVPQLGGSRKTAAINAHNANVRTLESAATMWIADNGNPTAGMQWTSTTEEDITTDDGLGWGTYLQEWPDVPVGAGVTGPYNVTIETDGTITVAPDRI